MSSSFISEQCELFKLEMVITGIIVVQINHISISVLEKFTEQKVNKFKIFFRKHWSSECVGIE